MVVGRDAIQSSIYLKHTFLSSRSVYNAHLLYYSYTNSKHSNTKIPYTCKNENPEIHFLFSGFFTFPEWRLWVRLMPSGGRAIFVQNFENIRNLDFAQMPSGRSQLLRTLFSGMTANPIVGEHFFHCAQ